MKKTLSAHVDNSDVCVLIIGSAVWWFCVSDVWLQSRHVELGLYAGQYDFSERALLPRTGQLRPGICDTRMQLPRTRHNSSTFTSNETDEWRLMNYWFHVHTHMPTCWKTQENNKSGFSAHTGLFGALHVSVRHRKSQTCNRDNMYLYPAPLSGVNLLSLVLKCQQ